MRWVWTLLLAGLVLVACRRDGGTVGLPGTAPHGAREPAEAVLLLTRHLRNNDLVAFTRDAVPPALGRELETAWREGRTRWPLDELPFDERVPTLLAALSAPDAGKKLERSFDQQFAGETAALKAAAQALGLFGAQYVRHEGDFSTAERAHYLQFVQALSRWAAAAPLSDPARAKRAIPQLTSAARTAGLTSEADFPRLGRDASLQRLSGLLRTFKQVVSDYGLRLDDSLGGLRATVESQQGNRASVRLRYTLGGSPIDAVVEVERVDGRWYLSDYLRHARGAVAVR